MQGVIGPFGGRKSSSGRSGLKTTPWLFDVLTTMKNVRFRGRGGRACVVALLLVLCAVASLPASASDRVAKLHRRQQAVAARQRQLQHQIVQADRTQSGLLAKISTLDARRASVQKKVRSLDSSIGALDSRIAATRARLQASDHNLSVLTGQLQSILRKLDTRTQAFAARAVATYKAGPTAALDTLLSSQSFGDLMDRYTYYQSALATDTDLIHQIQTLQGATESRRSAVQAQRAAIVAAKDRLQSDRSTLAQQRTSKRVALGSLKSLISKKHAAVAQIETHKAQLKAGIAENDRESAQIAALLQAATGGSASSATGSGQLLWPAVGPITSPFGWRIHPIFHTREFHPGIDIGAPYGATVSAADAGTVEFAGTMTGYGNVLVIDHGGGLATLYGHLSAYSVSAGESVGRGAPIAKVGCTGWCTGPHLHFEVRVFGTPVDPMPYLN
jgi:murein DD-endopeptidase MepM/ murein hydrolase activator NlpD